MIFRIYFLCGFALLIAATAAALSANEPQPKSGVSAPKDVLEYAKAAMNKHHKTGADYVENAESLEVRSAEKEKGGAVAYKINYLRGNISCSMTVVVNKKKLSGSDNVWCYNVHGDEDHPMP